MNWGTENELLVQLELLKMWTNIQFYFEILHYIKKIYLKT